MRRAFEEEVHTVVTDTHVSVNRTRSGVWHAWGAEIPFDAATTVGYLDPKKASTHLDFGDVRLKEKYSPAGARIGFAARAGTNRLSISVGIGRWS